MIRIRTKPTRVTLRIGDAPKQRYASAIHALHAIRVAVVEQGMVVEDTVKTQQALAECIALARAELDAAIKDVQPEQKRAVCVMRRETGQVELSYYQTTDHRHLMVNRSDGDTRIWEDDRRVWVAEQDMKADDAIRLLGYVIAPGGVP